MGWDRKLNQNAGEKGCEMCFMSGALEVLVDNMILSIG